MKRFLILGVSVAVFLCSAGTPAWAKATGNFDFKGGGAVGCHWATCAALFAEKLGLLLVAKKSSPSTRTPMSAKLAQFVDDLLTVERL